MTVVILPIDRCSRVPTLELDLRGLDVGFQCAPSEDVALDRLLASDGEWSMFGGAPAPAGRSLVAAILAADACTQERSTTSSTKVVAHIERIRSAESVTSKETRADSSSHRHRPHTLPGGIIRLTVSRTSEAVVVCVIDSGAGIAREMLPKIFDLFAQANRTLDRSQGGLGIGLSLVRMLVEMHDGIVVADSEGLGKGSTFTVRLPMHSIPQKQSLDTTPGETSRGTNVRRILVVDDNIDGAETLAMMLELAGHETCTVFDGEGAIAAAQSFHPDLVFLDIGLPGIDGYRVAELFRADTELSKVLLVALTGFAGEDDKRRTREAGFDLHLTKPVTCSMVEEAIARVA